ncbi:hypothetical protein BG015_001885 [Linnemannia schmuckeri]|uniref:3beta-hydroxysteroid 3-dehydrogenase n=1 Tax=Linnemannia schmuckeri TaxID=64567 RepID=A0A9P5RPP8_9FUNG|nr:hypothetical protein BG015_001885 [Linnemannia schmuckeri]
MAIERKVAIVTGANSGVGYSIVQRLVDESPFPLTVILACRNKARAQEALTSLQVHFSARQMQHIQNNKKQQRVFHAPELKIELVDVGSSSSVLAFNARILAQHDRVDFLFCNAGILPSVGLMWGKIFTDMFKSPRDLVTRSDVLVQPKQYLTEDGIGNVLACNVFGHYLMIKGLEEVLSKTEEDPGRVIWTGSMTAEKASFRIDDWQGLEAIQPYESSKWVTDLLAIRLNEEWAGSDFSDSDMASVHSAGAGGDASAASSGSETSGASTPTRRITRSTSKTAIATNTTPTTTTTATTTKKHIISLCTQPGVVGSGIGGLAAWIVLLRLALHYAVRIIFGEHNQTITGHHGAKSNVYVALKQPVEKLDYRSKYGSCVRNFGQEFLKVEKVVEYERSQAEVVVGRLEALRQEVLVAKK